MQYYEQLIMNKKCKNPELSYCVIMKVTKVGFPVYLQAVGQDDVGVHCSDIQMVDEGTFYPVWDFLQRKKLLLDVFTHLRKTPVTSLTFTVVVFTRPVPPPVPTTDMNEWQQHSLPTILKCYTHIITHLTEQVIGPKAKCTVSWNR